MPDGVNTNLSFRLTATDTKTPPVGGASQQVNEAFALALAAGIGIGKSDILFTKAINIAASGSATIDLVGSLTDVFGATVNLADIQVLYLEADATNVNDIVMGNGATNPWVGPFDAGTDTVGVHPGGMLLFADPKGWPVVPTTGDLLKLANSGSGTAVTGKLVLIGRSA